MRRSINFVEMQGRRFGAWTVLRRAENSKDGNAQWHCRHDCGGEDVVLGHQLRRSPPRTCSTCRDERRKRVFVPHQVLRKPHRICPGCSNLPHRRPLEGCVYCGGEHCPEPPIAIEAPLPRSGLGRAEEFA